MIELSFKDFCDYKYSNGVFYVAKLRPTMKCHV